MLVAHQRPPPRARPRAAPAQRPPPRRGRRALRAMATRVLRARVGRRHGVLEARRALLPEGTAGTGRSARTCSGRRRTSTPRARSSMWLNSPPHKKNMLTARWREIGLSAVHVTRDPGVFDEAPGHDGDRRLRRQTLASSPVTLSAAPVAQWKSGGLLSRGSEVRILPGASSLDKVGASHLNFLGSLGASTEEDRRPEGSRYAAERRWCASSTVLVLSTIAAARAMSSAVKRPRALAVDLEQSPLVLVDDEGDHQQRVEAQLAKKRRLAFVDTGSKSETVRGSRRRSPPGSPGSPAAGTRARAGSAARRGSTHEVDEELADHAREVARLRLEPFVSWTQVVLSTPAIVVSRWSASAAGGAMTGYRRLCPGA